ncbi:alkaline phosphatase [Dyadobacter jejuensis]|uniref:Alkaline phosphatase n=1 Tax=Dyadobacter jejuensis TaxID=1082580 RepID=A0A316AJP9_9BACT|nr:alkaline phosphatase [Dyadobacter jejuensis]PWJ57204.1 alkaline phosphatase [Dyadobacter jejuensis]
MKFFRLCLILLSLSSSVLKAQTPQTYTPANAHSHNDYEQQFPFELAYKQGFGSIEADVYAVNDSLFVAHDRKDIRSDRSLISLYLKPIHDLLQQHHGKIYKNSDQELQLLIDLKTDGALTIPILVKELKNFPALTAPGCPVKIVLSGSTPAPADFDQYPDYILYDGRPEITYTASQLKRVGLISQAFYKYSKWNGKGVLTDEDKRKVNEVIEKVHSQGKKIRLWATPDAVNPWKMLMNLGLDYINTDHVQELGAYLKGREKAEFTNAVPHSLYTPTYKNNDQRSRVKNVILLIGDGMGLAQIHAGLTANHGALNLTQLLNIGFSKTASADSYITDSAAGATAMATGHKTHNRGIGVDATFKAVDNLPEMLKSKGVKTALISAGDITDATPAAFYAHQPFRDYNRQIAHDYLRSPVEILIGGNYDLFHREKVLDSLQLMGFQTSNRWADLPSLKAPFVLLDDSKTTSIQKGRGDFLSSAFKASVDRLKTEPNGFFLMAEGAQIDYGGHGNNVGYVASEMLDFDTLVGEALRFADTNGETLVVITADHETGGLTLLDGDFEKGYVDGQFSTNDHTAIMVPVFAYGPHSLDFRGVYENTEIFQRIKKLLLQK